MTSGRSGSAVLAAVVLAIVAMLVVPLPPAVLDGLLALDVMAACTVLVAALSVQNPLELSAFPSLVLIATLFRLSLDVSATRLILTQGDVPGGAGTVIPAFGEFVMRSNVIVGLLLFIILLVVQLAVVTNGTDAGLGDDLARQLSAHPHALRAVGGAMLLLGLAPGMPHIAFAALGAGAIGLAYIAERARESADRAATAEDARRKRSEARAPAGAVALVGVDQLAIEVGEALLPLLEEPAGSALLSRIASLRTAVAMELGLILPSVRVRDDLRLPTRGYAVRVRDRVAARGELHPDRSLVIGDDPALSAMPGEPVRDPVTGEKATWLSPRDGERLTSSQSAIVVDPIAVLTSALARAVRSHAHALLGRQEVQALLDHVRRTHPAAVKGVVPELASLGLVQRVLQHLVREGVSIRDVVAVLETIADEAEGTKDAVAIGEAVRSRLAAGICATIADADGVIRAAVLSPQIEERMTAALVVNERGPLVGLDPSQALAIRDALQTMSARIGRRAVIVCREKLRPGLARFVESAGVAATVLGIHEIAPGYALSIEETVSI